MKKTSILFLAAALIFTASQAFSQKIVLREGNLEFLKGQTNLNIEYDYTNMTVGKYSNDDYVAKKQGEYNEKEAGKGDKWKQKWYDDREQRFEPLFETLFVKGLASKAVNASQNNSAAKYTMVLKTTMTEPGYFIGYTSQPAFINAEVTFFDINDKQKVLAKIEIIRSPGIAGADWDTGERIKEAYAKCGKSLAKYFLKLKAF